MKTSGDAVCWGLLLGSCKRESSDGDKTERHLAQKPPRPPCGSRRTHLAGKSGQRRQLAVQAPVRTHCALQLGPQLRTFAVAGLEGPGAGARGPGAAQGEGANSVGLGETHWGASEK